MADSDSLEDRVPCSDDMCVGIIGPNGKCGMCGKPGTPPQQPPHPHDDLHGRAAPEPEPEPEPDHDHEHEHESAAPAAKSAADDAESDSTPDPSDRIPCLDEMCVGILSKKGRCGTCGRQWPRP